MEVKGIITGKKYKVSALNFGQRNEILDNSTVQHPETGMITLKTGTMRALYIHHATGLSLEAIAKLPDAEGLQLLEAARRASQAPLESSQQQSSQGKGSKSPQKE